MASPAGKVLLLGEVIFELLSDGLRWRLVTWYIVIRSLSRYISQSRPIVRVYHDEPHHACSAFDDSR